MLLNVKKDLERNIAMSKNKLARDFIAEKTDLIDVIPDPQGQEKIIDNALTSIMLQQGQSKDDIERVLRASLTEKGLFLEKFKNRFSPSLIRKINEGNTQANILLAELMSKNKDQILSELAELKAIGTENQQQFSRLEYDFYRPEYNKAVQENKLVYPTRLSVEGDYNDIIPPIFIELTDRAFEDVFNFSPSKIRPDFKTRSVDIIRNMTANTKMNKLTTDIKKHQQVTNKISRFLSHRLNYLKAYDLVRENSQKTEEGVLIAGFNELEI